MKKITAGNLISWNGTETTIEEIIEWLSVQPRLDDKHAKLLSDMIVAHNNFVSVEDELLDD